MTQEVIEALSSDERTVLEICAEGGIIAEIGRWKEPVERLVKKGYLEGPQFNHYITPTGRKALSGTAPDDERALAAYVDKFRDMEIGRSEIAAAITAMVDPWVQLVEKSSKLSGKTADYDLMHWLAVLRKEVIAKLDERR